MNDEIEATLEWLKSCGENDYLFETGNSKMLLDYITNLQQENNNLKTSLDESQEVVIDLQQENEKYKKHIKENLRLFTENYELKSRIEKAIKYIEKHRKVYKLGVNQETDEFDYISTSPQVLLNILRGEDK